LDLELLAIDFVVLCSNDLPLTFTFQPGIGPGLALLRVGVIFVFAYRVLAAANDCHVFTEKAHFGIFEGATVQWKQLKRLTRTRTSL